MTSEINDSATDAAPHDDGPIRSLVPRAVIGGVLMGLANLVPGISGGTMLLAAGVYPRFISAIAEITTFEFKPRSLVLLGTVAGAAALAILLLAGLMRSLVIEQRFVMYSIFIGLTLGGLPLVWRLAKPVTPAVFIGAGGSFLFMIAMQMGLGAGNSGDEVSGVFLFLSGLAGASAMILPGVSGGYLLLLLGQYEVILGSIDTLKQGLLGGPDFDLLMDAMTVVVPVGIGVVAGIIGVSNLLRWLLDRYAKATLGALLGLLLGAVIGLWPFQQPVEPEIGSVVKGRIVTAESRADIKPKDWPLLRFDPTAGQVGSSIGLMIAGLAVTLAVARLGDQE